MSERPIVGLLHPGAMGVTIGRALQATSTVIWAGEGRSAATIDRAASAGLEDAGTVDALAAVASVIVSVCPPGEAISVARSIAEVGFAGRYVDANAVSPASARIIGGLFDDVVDGGIIGPPINGPGTTRLYLSGDRASDVAALFDASDLDVRLVDGGPGAASAVKMAFAAWTKGTSALLLAINAVAEFEGVRDDLVAEWSTSMPELVARSERLPGVVGPKAWRFEDEMHEIASTFAAVGLPEGFHLAAAETYRRLSGLKGVDGATLADVLGLLDDRSGSAER